MQGGPDESEIVSRSRWRGKVQFYKLKNLEIAVDKQRADRHAKVTYPIRYGRFCEIRTPEYLFQFNLNGEVKYIRGLSRNWPHPAEWLKRTDVNIGFEPADAATLRRLNKQLGITKIEDAFQMVLDVNRNYHNIEITVNFLLEDQFPPNHYQSLIDLVRNRLDRFYSKGGLYFVAENLVLWARSESIGYAIRD